MRAVACAVLLAACSGSESPGPSRTTVVDSAGTTIVDNGVVDTTVNLLASPTPVLQVGVIAGADELQLFRVADVKRLSDGGVAVANGGTRELRIYNADGSHRATAGGPGRGPGEFRYPSALSILAGDTIQVEDFRDRVFFAPNGNFIRRAVADMASLSVHWTAGGGSSEGGQWLADGSFFAPVYHWDRNPPTPGPLFRPVMTLIRVSADLSRVDTLGDFGGVLQQYIDVGGDRRVTAIVPPFATNTWWALGSADGAVVVADNAAPQIERFHPDGSHTIVRWSAPTQSTSRSEVEEWKERQRKESWVQNQLPELERGWAAMEIPETRPHFGPVTTGSDGTSWVGAAESAGGGTTLTAFSAQGTYLGMVQRPGRFTVFDSGPGWLLGVLQDENDVEFVQMYELQAR
jgi:hypothetical protein